MEITRGQLTFGLLATEMVTGRIQVGENDFITQDPSTIPVAGDEDGGGPSYATSMRTGRTRMGGTSPADRAGDQSGLHRR